jgi:hypothetical protein
VLEERGRLLANQSGHPLRNHIIKNNHLNLGRKEDSQLNASAAGGVLFFFLPHLNLESRHPSLHFPKTTCSMPIEEEKCFLVLALEYLY